MIHSTKADPRPVQKRSVLAVQRYSLPQTVRRHQSSWNICHCVIPPTLWFSFLLYRNASRIFYSSFTQSRDGKSSMNRPTLYLRTPRVSTGFYKLISIPGRVLVHLTFQNTLSPCKSLTFAWFIRVLPQCFHLYLVFKSPLRPVSLGAFCICGESSKCHFFLGDNWTQKHSGRDFLRASLWQSDIQVNVCSRRREIPGLTRTIWQSGSVLCVPFSVKLLINIQGWWILQRWTDKHLFGTFAWGEGSCGGRTFMSDVNVEAVFVMVFTGSPLYVQYMYVCTTPSASWCVTVATVIPTNMLVS